MAFFMVLCLPLQAMASILLPCAHSAANQAGEQVSCHTAHTTSGNIQQDFPAEQCQKCDLQQMLNFGSFVSEFVSSEMSEFQSVQNQHVENHFYQFSPHLILRPPLKR
jgi:hypothetical protein